jgi:hypothetical protein
MKHILFALVAVSGVAGAQGRPFDFTVVFPDGTPQTVIRYTGGYGSGTFEPLGFDHVAQTVELDIPIGRRVVMMGTYGLDIENPTSPGTSRDMAQVEALFDALRFSGWHLAVSGGVRQQYDGSTMALARLSLGKTTKTWSFAANLYGTRAFQGADATQIKWNQYYASIGATAKVAPGVNLGLETVASDIEGLWSSPKVTPSTWLYGGRATPVEIFGAPRGITPAMGIFTGPLASFALPGHKARLNLSAGPIIHTAGDIIPGYTGKYGVALRTLNSGYMVRLALSFGL